MKIEQKSFFIGNNQGDGQNVPKNALMFGRGLIKQENPIEEKRKEAQKQAKKIIDDVVSREYKLDEDLKNRGKHIDELRKEMQTGLEQIEKVDKEREKLRKEYNVDGESQEQKDLELLEKNEDASEIPPKAILTKEEAERIAEIKKNGMTEYQTRMLGKYKDKNRMQGDIDILQLEVNIEIATIKAVNGERLKSNPVLDAVEQAEEIEKAADKEIQGMIIEEAKEEIEEKAEKIKEDAENKVEEEKKREEKLEKLKEKIAKREEELQKLMKQENRIDVEKVSAIQSMPIIENEMMGNNEKIVDIRKEIETLMESMKLITEDMKGVVVDFKR